MKILKVNTERRRIGNLGEDIAADFLKKKRYKILERNYATDFGEIDIICYRKKTLYFVEVKTRRRESMTQIEPRPASAVTPEKQRKLISVANYFKKSHKKDCRMQFDIIEVILDGEDCEIHHLENTVSYNTAYDNF
jgi:putative endonuclease